ncbi:MAG: creatininase family protein [Gemmatimonadota bacterium]
MMRPWSLASSALPLIRKHRYEVAVLPWGATEAHNYHLPYGTDTIESDSHADRAAAIAWERGARILVLPAIPFGVQTGQLDVPFCLNLNPTTQLRLIADLLVSIERHGIRKLVLFNGHGGNDFRQIIRELQPSTPVFLCQLNWYTSVDARQFFTEPGDHGGELETSLMMHLAPELVGPLSEAGDGAARRPRVAAFREGWAWAPRRWSQVTVDTGIGSPALATAERGARYSEAVVTRVSNFLVELAAMDPDDPYE